MWLPVGANCQLAAVTAAETPTHDHSVWPGLPCSVAAGFPEWASQGDAVEALLYFIETSLASHMVSLLL